MNYKNGFPHLRSQDNQSPGGWGAGVWGALSIRMIKQCSPGKEGEAGGGGSPCKSESM